MDNKKLLKFLARADLWLMEQVKFYSVKDDFGRLTPVLSRLATLGLILVTILIVGWCAYWILHVGPQPDIANPALQLEVPNVEPSPTPRSLENRWQDHNWLTQSEALELRQMENAINLALLDDGAIVYSAESSVELTEQAVWLRNKPFGVTNISVMGTTIQLVIGGRDYNLNLYQPFVLVNDPDEVHIVDSDGQLWSASLEDTGLLCSIEMVRDNLPIVIAPNENLSASYWRQ